MTRHRTVQELFRLTPEQLAVLIGDLRYDELALFFNALSEKITADAQADKERQRFKLANALVEIGVALSRAHVACTSAWRISKPFMRALKPSA